MNAYLQSASPLVQRLQNIITGSGCIRPMSSLMTLLVQVSTPDAYNAIGDGVFTES